MARSNQNATVAAAADTSAATEAARIKAELEALPTTSAKIRYLTAKNVKRGDIAKILGIRYQHVRNVQLQPLKRTELK